MATDSNKPNVMVLEAQAKAILPIARSLHRNGRRVIVGAPQRLCLGFFSRYVSQRVVYPSPIEEPDAFVEFIINYLSQGHVDMLFPVDDVVTDLIAKHQDEIRKHTKLILPAYDVFYIGHDKVLTNKAAEASGVPIPRTWYPDEQPLDEIAREAEYPCLIKPAISVAAVGITRVHSADELMEKYPLIDARFDCRCFIQELIPHEGGIQHKCDILMGEEGKVLGNFVYDKLRYYPPVAGSSTLNKIVYRPDLVEHCTRMLRDIGWYGFADSDFITDPRDGMAKLMEINPRFPDSLEASYVAGMDLVEIMYQMAHGHEPEPQLDYNIGHYLRFLPGDLMWFVASPNRFKEFWSWMNFLSPKMHYTIIHWRDPGPALGYLLENLIVLFNRKKRKERFRLDQAMQRKGAK